MTKTKKTNTIKEKKEDNVKITKGLHKGNRAEDVEEEDLPEDVQEALGIKKQSKAKIKEVDYISELENGFDDFGMEENTSKNSFDEEFDSDID